MADSILLDTMCGLPTAPAPRGPVKAVKVAIPVWGFDFVHQFLRVSLPTYLAPGNLPAVADMLPTEVVFLTSVHDEAMFRESLGFRRLEKHCQVGFQFIDDMITESNHSTTLTLSFVQTLRQAGEAMLDTCFMFPMSDYIVADGSFASAVSAIVNGASAVQAGNFQVVAEEAQPWLSRELAQCDGVLALPPRRLMRHALAWLHPMTLAHTVNLPASHNSYSNRLFWRVDPETLIGRFFLIHPICIRPERTEFMIGSSHDYSFIPELCPSGNVATLTDSDAYLVVEAQPRHHESQFLRLGPTTAQHIAVSLSEWTTAQHRDNARHTVVFHAGEVPESIGRATAEADRFVAEIDRFLTRNPMPHQNHPYWRGAIAAHDAMIGRRPNQADWELMLGHRRTPLTRLISAAHRLLLGSAPTVRYWHPRRREVQQVRSVLLQVLAKRDTRLLAVSGRPTPITNWLAETSERVQRIPIARLLRTQRSQAQPDAPFNFGYLEINDREMEKADAIINEIAARLAPGSEILVAAFNDHWDHSAETFAERLGENSYRLVSRPDLEIVATDFVRWRRWWWSANAALSRAAHRTVYGSPLLIPLRAVGVLFRLLFAMGVNLLLAPNLRPRTGGIVSSLCMRLRLAGAAPPVCTVAATRGPALEPSPYANLIELRRSLGVSCLGLMTNQIWNDDPRRLGFLLARYKFVAKMLSGLHEVAELGCGDGFGTRVVQQEIDTVTAYDIDPIFIDDIKQRQPAMWPLEAHQHDILKEPLPRRYEAVYSLDVIEHIPAEQERHFVANLTNSLVDHGFLIVGTPSLESQAYASPPSRAGHVNCKSGRELKGLLQKYFHTVLLFSMNDEVVHTGFYPMAHYLLAVCVDKKT